MDSSLLDLLKPKPNKLPADIRLPQTVNNPNQASHVTLFGPYQLWDIPDQYQSVFWPEYCRIVSDNSNRNIKNICLAETPKPKMPIIVDLCFKFNHNPEIDEYCNNVFLMYLVYCYQRIIAETVTISPDAVELICCVLEADKCEEDGMDVCRVRLQFPYCKTKAEVQNRLIRPLVLQMIRNENVIGKLPCQPVNDWDNIIDSLVVEKPVTMYGSISAPKGMRMYLNYIVSQYLTKENVFENKAPLMDESQVFFFQNHELVINNQVDLSIFPKIPSKSSSQSRNVSKDDDDEENEEQVREEGERIDYDFWLPYFLSIGYNNKICEAKKIVPSDPVSAIVKLKMNAGNNYTGPIGGKKNKNSFDESDKDSPRYLAKVFLGMLSPKRLTEDYYWLDIGKALFNVFSGDEEGLDVWVDYTNNSDDQDHTLCEQYYYKFNINNRLTLKTLAFYAREDSPDEYDKWHKEWYAPMLEAAISCTHADVAKAFYRVYWLDFACSNIKAKTLYHYRNHFWKLLDSGVDMKALIHSEFVSVFEAYRTFVSLEVQNTHDPHVKDSAEVRIGKICKLINKLKNRGFKNDIFSEAAENFYNEDFEKILDMNPDLMGCVNGVIECLETRAIFRDGKPEDYVSRTTGVVYPKKLHKKHPDYLKVIDYLNKAFPDKGLMHHFSKIISSSLRGRNSSKIFPIYVGKGNNSKSMLKKLIEFAWGDYAISIPPTYLTETQRATNADPVIARGQYAHLAFSVEQESTLPLKSSLIKLLTGSDKIFARFLNSNGGDMMPMFTIHMQCNMIPLITESGPAIKSRIKCLYMGSQWTDAAPKDPDEQMRQKIFPIDPFFEKHLEEMAPAFLWHCVDVFAAYRKEGLVDPPCVVEYTNKYWEDNDLYAVFIKENIERAYKPAPPGWSGDKVPDDSTSIKLSDMYSKFKEWHKEAYGNIKCPDRNIFKNEMESRITKCIAQKFFGVKFKAEVMIIDQ